MIKITLTKSVIGATPTTEKSCGSVGIKKDAPSVVHADSPQTSGAVEKVEHLVTLKKL